MLAAGCCWAVALSLVLSWCEDEATTVPQSCSWGRDIIPASVWAFQHRWSLGFGNGGSFPTCGEISLPNCKYQPSGKGYGWCEAMEDGGTAEVLMNTGGLHCLPKISDLWISFLLQSLMLGNALCICSAGAESVRAL